LYPCPGQCKDKLQHRVHKTRIHWLAHPPTPHACCTSLPQMQRHITLHGAVITRLTVYSDFRPFFAANRSGVYPGPGKGANKTEDHAVSGAVGSWLCVNTIRFTFPPPWPSEAKLHQLECCVLLSPGPTV
jgi:hypothetical protein